MSSKVIHTKNPEETQALAAEWVKELRGLTPKQATVVGLRGDLGSGKTSFVQGVARALGVEEHITSPTFILERVYRLQIANCSFCHLVHIDAYRLDSASELAHLGFAELAREPENLILIEWPERVSGALPSDMPVIKFEFVDETTRKISL